MNIGVSTACFYPEDTLDALDKLLANNFNLFEVFFNTYGEIQEPFLNEILKRTEPKNAIIKSVHPFTSGYESFLLFSDHIQRYKETLRFYELYFKSAVKLGAKFVVIHGDRRTPEIGGLSNAEYFDRFAELSLLGEKYGLIVAQENVNLYRSQKIEFVKEMCDYLGDRAKFVLDIKQAVRSGTNPNDMCEAMGKHLVHIHLNDNNLEKDCLLPGVGSMDYSKILNTISKNQYDGDFIIEVYRSNFNDIDDLVKSYEYVKKTINNSGLYTIV